MKLRGGERKRRGLSQDRKETIAMGDLAAPFSHVSEECATYLWLDQDQIDEQHDEIMLDVFVGEAFAAWTLCEAYTFAESLVIGFAVCGV